MEIKFDENKSRKVSHGATCVNYNLVAVNISKSRHEISSFIFLHDLIFAKKHIFNGDQGKNDG